MTVQKFFQRGARRASFEADKLQRTLKVQNTIGNLRTQIKREVVHLGETALRLYREGALAEDELKVIAQAIEALEAQVAEQGDCPGADQGRNVPRERSAGGRAARNGHPGLSQLRADASG